MAKRNATKDPKYLAWVRSQPCVSCGAPSPSHAHHHTHARGVGQKAPDVMAMPLCHKCHMDFHDGRGKSAGLSNRERTKLQDAWCWATRTVWCQLRREELF